MTDALITGFILGLTLIVAIGAQNAFVLRQGILRHHIFYISLFCSLADSFLIFLGVIGISYFLNNFFYEYSKIIFGLASLWLFAYGVIRLSSAFKTNSSLAVPSYEAPNLLSSISIISIFTFLNPHVYLDTVILIGSISQQFFGINRIYFAIGACSASFLWFFSLGYGSKILTPIMQQPKHWRTLDLIIAFIMFVISYKLASQGGWL
ncbi:LysE/ArgO family amino acid transporter [Pseudothioglobus sp. nBUS_23]|uniref:LysE/ArgO family amino acid transporter n=1 Tax=Pseudothioglobus sp. nBUS_23 TaxID=3395318 RepID=UPI003EB9D79D